MISNKIYKLISKQREAFNWQLLIVSIIPVSRIFDNEDDIFILSRILWNINYIRMNRKIIDDYCLELNWLLYDPRWVLQLSELVWMLRSSASVVFNNLLLIDAINRSKISSDQKRLFFAVSLYCSKTNFTLDIRQWNLASHFYLLF